jgi:hypothetical protein
MPARTTPLGPNDLTARPQAHRRSSFVDTRPLMQKVRCQEREQTPIEQRELDLASRIDIPLIRHPMPYPRGACSRQSNQIDATRSRAGNKLL